MIQPMTCAVICAGVSISCLALSRVLKQHRKFKADEKTYRKRIYEDFGIGEKPRED